MKNRKLETLSSFGITTQKLDRVVGGAQSWVALEGDWPDYGRYDVSLYLSEYDQTDYEYHETGMVAISSGKSEISL